MSQVYNANEIYAIGIEIEKNGERFYEEIAAQQVDPELAGFFTNLAKWEGSHVMDWEALKAGFSEKAREINPYDPEDQEHLYLKSTADNHIFIKSRDISYLVLTCKTGEDALNLAMRFEQDSVAFYAALAAVTPEEWGKDKIQRLVEEEQRHIAMLEEKLNSLEKR